METFKILIPIIVAIISFILSPLTVEFLNQFQRRRRLKNLSNALEVNSLLNHFDENFKNKFINPDLKETYFFIQTGISTNEKSIFKLIEFKNKLGENYTWKAIKISIPHLDFTSEEIKIKEISKLRLAFANIASIIGLLLILITFGLLVYFNQFKIQAREVFLYLYIVIVPAIYGYFILMSVYPVFIAKKMERSLKSK